MSTNPIDNVEWVAPGSLVANHYNPNRVHKAEARLLEFSLVDYRLDSAPPGEP
jgi:hypothetical protein